MTRFIETGPTQMNSVSASDLHGLKLSVAVFGIEHVDVTNRQMRRIIDRGVKGGFEMTLTVYDGKLGILHWFSKPTHERGKGRLRVETCFKAKRAECI